MEIFGNKKGHLEIEKTILIFYRKIEKILLIYLNIINIMNYYYDLPIDVINHIESYLIIKPNEIVNFINNPPKIFKKC